jgi:Family of unknown function (DUF6134)
MDRRSFLLSAGAYALPIPSGDAMHFRVLRNGSPIGDHYITFNPSGSDLVISIAANLLVRFAGIAIFRYAVKATEFWENGVFQQLDSVVNYNGSPLEVHAERIAGGYSVQGTHVPRYTAPPNLLPLTYWNKAMMNGTILNIQTAHSYPVTVNSPGWNTLPNANGGTISAQRFDLTGKLRISIWYDQNNTWSGLEFQKDGDISYERYV